MAHSTPGRAREGDSISKALRPLATSSTAAGRAGGAGEAARAIASRTEGIDRPTRAPQACLRAGSRSGIERTRTPGHCNTALPTAGAMAMMASPRRPSP